ncbi:fimbrial biogenesis chaperone [Stenotrophomonas maltophilia group sp. P373]
MRCLTRVLIAAVLMGGCLEARADLGVERTRAVQIGDSVVSVRVWNEGTRDSLVQAWVDAGNESARPEDLKVPYMVLPPMFRLPAGRNHDILLRRIQGVALPQDRESAFWINILDVPSAARAEDTLNLDYAVSWRIKLFHRPARLKGSPEAAAASLRWGMDRNGATSRLWARNDSALHVSLAKLGLDGRELELKPTNALIKPFSTWSFPLDEEVEGARLEFTWIDDEGIAHQREAVVSSP